MIPESLAHVAIYATFRFDKKDDDDDDESSLANEHFLVGPDGWIEYLASRPETWDVPAKTIVTDLGPPQTLPACKVGDVLDDESIASLAHLHLRKHWSDHEKKDTVGGGLKPVGFYGLEKQLASRANDQRVEKWLDERTAATLKDHMVKNTPLT